MNSRIKKTRLQGMEMHETMSESFDRVIIKLKPDAVDLDAANDEATGEERRTFRATLLHLLHSHKFQVFIVSLVIFDCILVLAELLIDLHLLQIHVDYDHTLAEVLHFLSISILCLFVVEVVVKLYAFRLEFFHHWLEVFDAIIIIISLILDITFLHIHTLMDTSRLIIILRLWRVVRILNGVVMSVKMQAEQKLEKERAKRESADHELEKYQACCALQEQDIVYLHGLLRENGIAYVHNSAAADLLSSETPSQSPPAEVDVFADGDHH